MRRRRVAAGLVVLALALGACAGSGGGRTQDFATGSLVTLATLRTGTIQGLRERRGSGPSRVYPLAPEAMLDVLVRAASKARGRGGLPVSAVFVNAAAREVIAKERDPEDAAKTGYSAVWLSAMVASVDFVPGRGDAARVEIHACHGGAFQRGIVDWERDMPRWIDEVLADDAGGEPAVKPIP